MLLNTLPAEIHEAARPGADHTAVLETPPPGIKLQPPLYLGPRPNNAAYGPLRTHLISLFLCGPFNH